MQKSRDCFRIVAILTLACAPMLGQTQLSLTTSPTAIEINQTSRLLISLTNVNPAGNAQVLTGDVIRVYLSLGDGAVQSVDPNLVLAGTVFQAGDWVIDSSAGPNPVTLVYQGVSQLWPALESVAVSLQIRPPSSLSVGEIVLRVPTDGRYAGQEWQVSTINLVSGDLLAPSAAAISALSNVTAVIGPQGPAGPQGPQGTPGQAGSQGPLGAVGPAGPLGPTGAIGPAGPAGPVGPQGIAGPIGPAGSKGSQGEVGPAGPAGTVGPAGSPGLPGLAGPMGPVGQQGPPGLINIYSTNNSEEIDVSADANKTSKPIQVLTLSLPQGSYWISAQVALWNGGIIPEIAQCNLGPAVAGATIDGLSVATLPLQTTTSGGTQTLQCSINGASKVIPGAAWMTAVQGLNIVNQ